ncbi:MAG: hypothetical protein NTY53_26420 [Kiritimatiellaeota bacterium]|nr:hypothetical protein [Kiritimatiellota bacterium]
MKKYLSESMIMTGLEPPTARRASCNLSEVPMIGKLRANFFQALEKQGTPVSNDWK